jgi:hypothetical protein
MNIKKIIAISALCALPMTASLGHDSSENNSNQTTAGDSSDKFVDKYFDKKTGTCTIKNLTIDDVYRLAQIYSNFGYDEPTESFVCNNNTLCSLNIDQSQIKVSPMDISYESGNFYGWFFQYLVAFKNIYANNKKNPDLFEKYKYVREFKFTASNVKIKACGCQAAYIKNNPDMATKYCT